MDHKAKVGIAMRNDSLKREVAFFRTLQKMREEMGRLETSIGVGELPAKG